MFFRAPICAKMKTWVTRTCENASVHGLIWYTRVENRLISFIIIILCIIVMFFTPTFVFLRCLEFGKSEKILTTTSSLRLKVATYPTITVCHGKYFTNERLARKYLLSKKFNQLIGLKTQLYLIIESHLHNLSIRYLHYCRKRTHFPTGTRKYCQNKAQTPFGGTA